MSRQGVTGPEHLKFVKFRFRFIVHSLLLQILEVMYCKKCTRVVVLSQSPWVNIIPVAWGASRMIWLSSWGQLPIVNRKAMGGSQQKKPRSLVEVLPVGHDAGISCELQKGSLLEQWVGSEGPAVCHTWAVQTSPGKVFSPDTPSQALIGAWRPFLMGLHIAAGPVYSSVLRGLALTWRRRKTFHTFIPNWFTSEKDNYFSATLQNYSGNYLSDFFEDPKCLFSAVK